MDIQAIKKAMMEQSDCSSDSILIPSNIQQDFLRKVAQENHGMYFLHSRYGFSIHNLYDQPVYLFKMGYLVPNSYDDLIKAHNAEVKQN